MPPQDWGPRVPEAPLRAVRRGTPSRPRAEPGDTTIGAGRVYRVSSTYCACPGAWARRPGGRAEQTRPRPVGPRPAPVHRPRAGPTQRVCRPRRPLAAKGPSPNCLPPPQERRRLPPPAPYFTNIAPTLHSPSGNLPTLPYCRGGSCSPLVVAAVSHRGRKRGVNPPAALPPCRARQDGGGRPLRGRQDGGGTGGAEAGRGGGAGPRRPHPRHPHPRGAAPSPRAAATHALDHPRAAAGGAGPGGGAAAGAGAGGAGHHHLRRAAALRARPGPAALPALGPGLARSLALAGAAVRGHAALQGARLLHLPPGRPHAGRYRPGRPSSGASSAQATPLCPPSAAPGRAARSSTYPSLPAKVFPHIVQKTHRERRARPAS